MRHVAIVVAFWVLVALVLLFFFGCSERSSGNPPGPSGLTVEIWGTFSMREAVRLDAAAREVVHAWEEDFGLGAPAVHVLVHDVEPFECFQLNVWGCFWDGVAHTGPSLKSLYHELCHAAALTEFPPRGEDALHEDPRWPEWSERGVNVALDITRDVFG